MNYFDVCFFCYGFEFVVFLFFKNYINLYIGIFNFVIKFLKGVFKLDLGFKLYIVYGLWEEFGCGDLVIKLYCDMVDVVSCMI